MRQAAARCTRFYVTGKGARSASRPGSARASRLACRRSVTWFGVPVAAAAAVFWAASPARLTSLTLAEAAVASSAGASGSAWSVLPVVGDGRCLFRALVKARAHHGGHLLAEDQERQQADELRAAAMDELVRRREELEWALDAQLDAYVTNMRQWQTWGGEMELLLCSHVMQRPVAVAMRQGGGDLRVIAVYGEQEYAQKGGTLHVLFHGAGHYEGLVVRTMCSKL